MLTQFWKLLSNGWGRVLEIKELCKSISIILIDQVKTLNQFRRPRTDQKRFSVPISLGSSSKCNSNQSETGSKWRKGVWTKRLSF
ncbi:uncharacterized protein ASCRUDRAFT_81658 [Ascoidea rubescens DSM 1968]|uniref:Uncharacterized protein n=1 Tax=Ascoidea rubescens DSM 1968 TaxID=1344418 RepID=A0A1D2VF36_9ASCO|nr:hypothetical protein ASCRUDRAFT_81658 [Ascoidea rubescens DSM 1968]ODV60235.1 hypothetical protein ASCRUDRAFT_81658 [Ascoidea rubescens DSM 1968]